MDPVSTPPTVYVEYLQWQWGYPCTFNMNLQILKVINEIGKGWGGKRAEEGLSEQKEFGHKNRIKY